MLNEGPLPEAPLVSLCQGRGARRGRSFTIPGGCGAFLLTKELHGDDGNG